MTQEKTISKRQFFATLATCVALLVVANAGVRRLTAHTVSRRILADAQEASSATIVALGNSLMRSGFVPEAFAAPVPPETKSPAVNLAMGASTPVEQLQLLRATLRVAPKVRLVLYGFYDFQLTDAVSLSNADIIGNHDILYYEEPEFARRYYQMARYETAAFEIDRRVSMLAERGAVWAKVELLRRAMGQQGMPSEARNRFGRAADFTLLEAKNRQEFEQHCAAASQLPLNAPVSEMIHEAEDRGIRTFFIVMPLPPKHVHLFYDTPAWGAYQQHVQKLLADQNVAYVDASRWIPDPGKFGDALHLNEPGAAEFSGRLGAFCHGLNRGESSCR